ncbi:MAG: multiheme c-type cytochrome [Thermoguttaceae bacterium]|nr:multiheme c-type cytochrome [Thermoguttaceae bacterium]
MMLCDLVRRSSGWEWAVVAVLAAELAGCGSPGSGVPSAMPVAAAADERPAPVVEEPRDNKAATEPERTAADVFKGTNLLEGAWAELRKVEKPQPADNSYCYVCHANYKDEDLTKVHLPVGVGCELCHGPSDKHSADEDGLTPPEIMWQKDWINVTCMECHPREALAKQDGHCEFLKDPFPDEVCTDCHGENHRLKVRTRLWDKKTGKLLECDGVRMMDPGSPAGAAK